MAHVPLGSLCQNILVPRSIPALPFESQSRRERTTRRANASFSPRWTIVVGSRILALGTYYNPSVVSSGMIQSCQERRSSSTLSLRLLCLPPTVVTIVVPALLPAVCHCFSTHILIPTALFCLVLGVHSFPLTSLAHRSFPNIVHSRYDIVLSSMDLFHRPSHYRSLFHLQLL